MGWNTMAGEPIGDAHSGLVLAVTGEGCILIDDTSRRYLDRSGVAALSCIRCCHSVINSASWDQKRELARQNRSRDADRPRQLRKSQTSRGAGLLTNATAGCTVLLPKAWRRSWSGPLEARSPASWRP